MTKFSQTIILFFIILIVVINEQVSARYIVSSQNDKGELFDRRKRDSNIFPAFYWKEKERKLEEALRKNRQNRLISNPSAFSKGKAVPLTSDYIRVYQEAYEKVYKSVIEELQNKSRRQQFSGSLENS